MGTQKTKRNQQSKALVFVSHAHKDRRLAKHFAKLLTDGIGLAEGEDFFCSSLPDAGTQSGEPKVETLRNRLKSAKIFIALVTPNYLDSPDCNAEMGYIWAAKKRQDCDVLLFRFKVPDSHREPFYFSELHTLDLGLHKDLNRILNSCRKHNLTIKGNNKWPELLKSFCLEAATAVPDAPENVDYASMGKFIDACDRFPRVLFFNVQVSFDDWFRPEMQTHLALQDATTTSWQLGKIVAKRGSKNALRALSHENFPAYYGTPTARVLFLTETRHELIEKLRGNKRDIRNFIDLTLIHLFMATPLAIITVDQLSRILLGPPERPNDVDFRQAGVLTYGELLGIPVVSPFTTHDLLIHDLRMALDRMTMHTTESGMAPASIDFALLMDNREPDGNQESEVWRAGLTKLRELHYYQVPPKATSASFYAFGKRIEHSVFKHLDKDEVKDNADKRIVRNGKKSRNGLFGELLKPKNELEQERLRHDELKDISMKRARMLLAKRHPCFGVFHDVKDEPELRWRFASAMKFVWPQYCPVNLIMEAGGVCGDVYNLVGD